MKKMLRLLMVVCLMCFMTACDGAPVETPNGNTGTTTAVSPEAETSTTVANESEVTPSTFEEITVVDNEECVIKITTIEEDAIWGYTLKAYLENRSADKTYMFSVDSATVNGVQCDPLFATEVAAGKKSNEDISFMDAELEENGVGEFTDIALSFRVYDSDDWTADAVAEVTTHVYPLGEEKATAFIRENQPTDTVLLDNEHVSVIATGTKDDEIWGYTVELFLLNKTNKEIMISVDEASVNGFMADPFYAQSLAGGACAFGSMSWSDETFAENGITDVEEIELTISVTDANDWLADALANETVVLNP